MSENRQLTVFDLARSVLNSEKKLCAIALGSVCLLPISPLFYVVGGPHDQFSANASGGVPGFVASGALVLLPIIAFCFALGTRFSLMLNQLRRLADGIAVSSAAIFVLLMIIIPPISFDDMSLYVNGFEIPEVGMSPHNVDRIFTLPSVGWLLLSFAVIAQIHARKLI